jgi:dephospho-CoA kinase
MIVAGLTGGICSGKSTATKVINMLGIPVIDADIVSREVVVPGSEGLARIINCFGSLYLLEDGTLNRKALSSLVFRDKQCLSSLNEIMRPLMQEEVSRQIELLKHNSVIVYSAALLCETGSADKYRPLIVLACSQETQIERLMKRNSLTHQQAMNIINSQMPTEQKILMADYVINTDGPVKESAFQTKKAFYFIRKNLGRFCFSCGQKYCQDYQLIMCEYCGFDNPLEYLK